MLTAISSPLFKPVRSYARFLALVALVMLVASGPAFAQTTYIDYDIDDDGLIDITSIANLQAIRFDHNGDGIINPLFTATDLAPYNAAYPNRDTRTATLMGCPMGTCTGYELMNNIDFASETALRNWTPGYSYESVLEGNGYTISNLRINRPSHSNGLFTTIGSTGVVKNLGLIAPVVNGQLQAGTLAATNRGTIVASYATGGSVSSSEPVNSTAGGLVAVNENIIIASYASVPVSTLISTGSGSCYVGGLVGNNLSIVNASPPRISSITTSYATGPPTCTISTGPRVVGGLVGVVQAKGVGGMVRSDVSTVTASYCDTLATGRSSCIGLLDSTTAITSTGYNTTQLQAPTGYTGIYANWNVDMDSDRIPDNPWNFGTASQYPTPTLPSQREQVVDYDMDNDGLIDITTLAQLNAIRYDLNGDGLPTGTNADTVAYAGAFLGGDITASTGRMGCPSAGCTGYELMNDLDFDTDGSGTVTSADAYPNWTPIGTFTATFNGNAHTISNLNINGTGAVGLFGALGNGGTISAVGMISPTVRSTASAQGIGSLVGNILSGGAVSASYASGGSVTTTAEDAHGGGLVGRSIGTITASYATVSVSSSGNYARTGGLVGVNFGGGAWGGGNAGGTVNSCFAAGSVSASGLGPTAGCLTGFGPSQQFGTVPAGSYYSSNVCSRTGGGGTAQTAAQLQSPSTYTGIYANWNVDVDGDRVPDNPWNFGTTSEYPTLNTPSQRVVDHDGDNDGLIDITTLAQLNTIRYDLNGDGLPIGTNADTVAYVNAFPGGDITVSSGRMGCPATCTGYELLNSLDFDTDGSGTVTATDAYPNWTPIGGTDGYTAEFNGNSNTITNLTITGSGSNAGLFSRLASGAIRDLGLITPSVSGIVSIGPLAAIISVGAEVSASYVQGGSVTCALTCHPGGLVGQNLGTIRASYAMASVSSGTFTNSFTGGLIGHNYGSVIASYAASTLTATGTGSNRGGLVGRSSTQSSRVTDSYCDTTVSGASIPCIDDHQFGSTATAEGKTTAELQTPTGYTGIYANWNIDLDGDNIFDFPWKFGTSSQYPTLNTPSQRQVLREIRVSISSQSVQEGRQGNDPTPLRFTVQLHKASMAPVTVAYADAGTGTATSGTDYTALAGGTLTFAVGETSKTITVSVIGDAVVEEAETVVITLSNPSPSSLAVLAVASATGTITDRSSTDPEPDPDTDPTFTEAIDPQSYYQNKAIEPLTLPEATDGNGDLTYSLTDLPEGLTFDAETRELSGTPTEAVEKAIYTLTVTDEDGDEDAMGFFLTIVANLMPSFGDANVAAQAYTRKQEITSVTLPQATGGDEPLTHTLTPDLPDGLKFNAETRVLSGTPLEAIAETTYTLTATDNDGDEATLMFTLVVTTDPIPIFGDTTIAAQGWQHQEIESLTLPQASGGNKPLTYALTPELPEGLTFDAETRIVSGTPLEAMDETTYMLTATDGNGDEAHLMFTLEVPDLVPAFGDSTTIAAQSYLVNQEIASLTFPQASSGDGLLVYILLPFLPEGLSFDPTTRTLSGLPTEEMAEATYTLSALDADGDTASLPFTLEVSLPSPDLNGDGNVNFADFLIFASKFNSRLGQERYDPWCDLNGDGEIDVDDFLIFADSFGT